jgi:glutamine synthetase
LTSPDKLIECIGQGLDRLKADVVHVGVFDYATIFRERRLKREELLAGASTAVFANVLPRWDSAESLIFPGPYGSETVAYDSASLRPYPFEANAAILVADYTPCALSRLLQLHSGYCGCLFPQTIQSHLK